MISRALLCAATVLATSLSFAQAKRAITIDDLDRFRDLSDLQCSPDGNWVAYAISEVDKAADKHVTQLAMVNTSSGESLRLTHGSESSSSPRWSPDGKYLSFTADRSPKDAKPQEKNEQVWLLDKRGGEARQLTHLKNFDIDEYEWSPDSTRLLLVLREKEPAEAADKANKSSAPKDDKDSEKPKPIVIDRYHFKEDIEGYLTSKRQHLYVYDIASGKLDQLTSGTFDEKNARWSPDSAKIAFVTNRDKDPDRSLRQQVFVVAAKAGATPQTIVAYDGGEGSKIAWSPDGKLIAYLQGSEGKYTAYNMNRLAVVPSTGGAPRILTSKLDRNVQAPEFSSDGKWVYAIESDDRLEYPIRVSVNDGSVERLVNERAVVSSYCSRQGKAAVLASDDARPEEIYALNGTKLRKLTQENDAVLSELRLAPTEDVSFTDPEGVEVHGLLTRPLDAPSGQKAPLLLRIHGGPNGQDAHEFDFARQLFAANGYAVLNINYRGSSGRGEQFQRAIFADWGNKEVADLLAGVDSVVKSGVADPDHLGIGGWSYGGILTDYTIATDTRFKGAISGAGSANQISMYGEDEYVLQYDNEIGPPWKNPDAWVKISYPFFKADRIKTPTLFMGGDKDFNVPIIGSEQMYQALKTLDIPTQLVVYPGEFHGFKRPSFLRDRYQRYLDWYAKWVKGSK